MVTRAGSLVVDLRLNSASFIREMGKSARAVDRNTKAMATDMAKLTTATKAATAAFATLQRTAIVLLGAEVARQVLQAGQAMEQLNNQLKLVTTSASDFVTTQRDLFNVAQETRSSLESTTELYARLVRSTEDLNVSDEQLLTLTRAINQSFAVSGANANEAANAITQLAQGFASGALRGDEFNSVMEQSPRLARALADELDVSIGELRAMAEQGQLTSETLIRAFTNQADEIQAEFEQTSKTVSQASEQLSNSWLRFNEALNDTLGIGEFVVGILDTIRSGVDAITESLRSLFGVSEELPALDPTKFLLPTDGDTAKKLQANLKAQSDAITGWAATVERTAVNTQDHFGSALGMMTSNLAQSTQAFAQADEDFFQTNKQIQMANTVVNTAAAVMKVWSQGGMFAAPIAATIAAIGAAQLAVIASAQPGGSSRAMSGGGGGGTAVASTAIAPQTGASANITLVGDTFNQDQIRELFDQINSGLRDGFRINLVTTQ